MIRWIGALLVLFATCYAGIEYSRNLQTRISQLKDLKKIMTELYSDVEYGACTLIESFERIGKKQETMYRHLLETVSTMMKKSKGMPFELIFAYGVDSVLKDSALRIEDREQLVQLGRQLGNNQRNGQLRIIQIYLQDLTHKIEQLERVKQEKQKLSRIIGISSGVLIVILLL